MTADERSSRDEFLNWYCWVTATNGERFFPPEKTADGCMEQQVESYAERNTTDEMSVWQFVEAYGWERGQHGRAWADAVEFFVAAKRHGLDPVGRAEREIDNARDDGLDLPDIDWTWLENSHYSEVGES